MLEAFRAVAFVWQVDKDGSSEVSYEEFLAVVGPFVARAGAVTAESIMSASHEALAAEVESLSAGGFAAGSLIGSLETPDGLKGAELVLFKLAQKIGLEGDQASTGFGTRFRNIGCTRHNFVLLFNFD